MNDQTSALTAIDERGRRAAASMRDLLDATDLDPDAGDDPNVVAFTPRRTAMPYLLAAAAAIVVVVAVVVLADRDDPAPVASDPPGFLLPSAAPLGLDTLGGSSDPTAGGQDDPGRFALPEGEVAIYAANPTMTSPSVAVLVIDDADGAAELRDGEPVTVQGTEANLVADGVFEPGGAGSFAVAFKRPGELVLVVATGLTRDDTLAAAEGAIFDSGRPGLAEAAIPDGLALQHRDRVASVVPLGATYVLDGAGASVVAYGDAAGSKSVILSTGPGDQRRVDAVRPFVTDPTEVAVRGTTGVAGAPFEDTVALTWLEGDNTVVRLLGYGGVTIEDLVAVAETLAPVSAGEFDDLVDALPTNIEANTPPDADLTLDIPGGVLFVVVDEAADSVEIGTQTDSRGSSSGTALSEFAATGTIVSIEEGQIFGLLGGDIARAEVVDGGVTTALDLVEVPGHPYRAFHLDGTTEQAVVRLFDAAGNEVQSG